METWLFLCILVFLLKNYLPAISMTTQEKYHYREKVREMFFHGYHSYMDHAYPADELMPLTCKGRVRGQDKGRGDIDDALGKFSLTLIDALDTLAVFGEVDEFSSAIQKVIRDVRFDSDVIVSVFETNIRVLGGLLGAHFAAVALKDKGHRELDWYSGELLSMSEELGRRLLPAFNTSTGLPYPKINLRYGMGYANHDKTTCTACAGTLLLEFAALSRLTGNPEFEVKAHRAMEFIWQKRHQGHNLVGTTINIHSGEWTRKESGVGAGIDSYYEYCLKSYILLGQPEYLRRFEKHYSAIKKYISSGPMLVDVSMNSPTRVTRTFMDSLLAFWPGLQVLWGDVESAIHTHDMLYHVTERYNFLPEAFTLDFRVHWGNHPLRPEFTESTYFLYQATGDPYYLDVGKSIVDKLDQIARVSCGYAAIKDVKTNMHEDRMDSYVLAETFKYLFLLFSDEEDLLLDMDDFVFNTEAHIFPLSLANINSTLNQIIQDTLDFWSDSNGTCDSIPSNQSPPTNKAADSASKSSSRPPPVMEESLVMPSSSLHCPNDRRPYVLQDQYEKLLLRQCTTSRFNKRPRSPSSKKTHTPPRLDINTLDFSNREHVAILEEMGILLSSLPGGKVQISHLMQKAKTPEDAEEGWHLMQDIMRLMNQQQNPADGTPKRSAKLVRILRPEVDSDFEVGPALFGPDLGENEFQVSAELVEPKPYNGCSAYSSNNEYEGGEELKGKIFLVIRGGCLFVQKVRNAQMAGAAGVIVADNLDPVPPGSSSTDSPSKTPIPFSMSGDGTEDVTIPAVFMKKVDASVLRELLQLEKSVYVLLTWLPEGGEGARKGEEIAEVPSSQKEDVLNSEESRSGESGLYNSGMESKNHLNQESGLYDNGMDVSESAHHHQHRDSAQTCSSSEDCNAPSDVP